MGWDPSLGTKTRLTNRGTNRRPSQVLLDPLMRAMESIPRVQHVALLTCAVTHYEQNTVRNRYPKLVKDFKEASVDLRPHMPNSTRTDADADADVDCAPSCSGADLRPPRLVPLIQVRARRRVGRSVLLLWVAVELGLSCSLLLSLWSLCALCQWTGVVHAQLPPGGVQGWRACPRTRPAGLPHPWDTTSFRKAAPLTTSVVAFALSPTVSQSSLGIDESRVFEGYSST